MQKSPLCSPLESYCTEMSQPLTVRHCVPSRSSLVHSYSAQEVASGTAHEGWCQRWRNLPRHTWRFLLSVLACTDLCISSFFLWQQSAVQIQIHLLCSLQVFFPNLCWPAWQLFCCKSFILVTVWACFWLDWKAYGFTVPVQMVKLPLWVTILPPC